MIAVIQRVKKAQVKVQGETIGKIDKGILVFVGVEKEDEEEEAEKLAHKIGNYRIFPDAEGKMNLSLKEIKGEVLVVSQFTLCTRRKKGLRPSFDGAAPPEKAERLYLKLMEFLKLQGLKVQGGVFGALMEVELTNDGPATFILKVEKK